MERRHNSENCSTMSAKKQYMKINLEELHEDIVISKSSLMLGAIICDLEVVSVKWSCYMVTSAPFNMFSGTISALQMQ